ncbi:MAG TPA: NAD-dependent succinate-semialdehyde dehydrogenase [bacterium]|nr:NAD-dependent succinate-semialdehyde dehydrogenase [bacterium]
MAVREVPLFIDGRWVNGHIHGKFEVLNPATSEPIAAVPDGGPEQARAAVDAAAQAFPKWAALTALQRGAILLKARDILTSRIDALARLITEENGKPVAEAKGEVTFGIQYLPWFAEEARRVYGEIVPPPVPHKRLWVTRQPIGVVAAITPWNFPATMVLRKIAPALAAGCTVVLKPPKETPLTAIEIARAFEEAGLPHGVFNVVVGKRAAPIAEIFMNDPRVRKIAFTGSTEIGKMLMAQAANQLKRVAFELGGNAPYIVFDDADLDRAVANAVAIKYFRVGGQSCICANRIYVQRPVAEAFLAKFTEAVRAIKVGSGFEPGVMVGPMINAETLEKVEGLVNDAVQKGARPLTGGHRLTEGAYRHGFFFAPTVLTNVTEEMPVAHDETFGPVAPVLVFDTDDEVIARSNNTAFGLAAYVAARDMRRIIRVSEALEYGLICVNDATGYTHEIPFGGFKESGLGREGGRQGIEEYMEVKSISLNIS